MRIGVFGGSFNPPHAGHLTAARAFVKEIALDRLIVIPAGVPPHKRLEVFCTDEDRLNMTRLNFSSLGEKLIVSDMEIRREGKSYTVDTLRELKNGHPHDALFLYCGSDMLTTFDQWYEYKQILSLCTLCAMRRDGAPGFEKAADALSRVRLPVRIISSPYTVESSTAIRKALAEGRTPEGLLPEVAQYISERGIYLEQH
ncbi:MAG: nicotinate (nicotinamide) nucleotide adenylyltransferase [Clostridia bacterium]|nr:nicotinate (nicotinamide) nucleotide adenylyltransferase [Clostridia bacterium]